MISFLQKNYVKVLAVLLIVIGGYLTIQFLSQPDKVSSIDLTDTHIMADGTVMTGAGAALSDASILQDGTIQLGDGTIITPAFDLRKKVEDSLSPTATNNKVVVDIVGTNFLYDVEEIVVKKGDEVTIHFSSGGGFHDWVLDEFDAKTKRVDKGESSSVTFVADEVGTFQYYCSVSSHREKGQVGYLIVE